MYCCSEEQVLRAIRSNEWDNNRLLRPSSLAKPDLSVSRLKIYSKRRIFAIFHRDFDYTQAHFLFAFNFNVGELEKCSLDFRSNLKQKEQNNFVPIKVKADPLLNDNESHAIVEPKITRGLANHIIKSNIGIHTKEMAITKLIYSFLRVTRFGKYILKYVR